jgi:hypothetical protein
MISPYQTFLYHSETRIVFSNRKKENRVGRRRHKLLRGPENSETRKTKEVKEARTTAHMRFGPATSGNQRPIQRQCILNGARAHNLVYIAARKRRDRGSLVLDTPYTGVALPPTRVPHASHAAAPDPASARCHALYKHPALSLALIYRTRSRSSSISGRSSGQRAHVGYLARSASLPWLITTGARREVAGATATSSAGAACTARRSSSRSRAP